MQFRNLTGKIIVVLAQDGRVIKRLEPEGDSASLVRVAHHRFGFEDGFPLFGWEYTSEGRPPEREGVANIVPRDLFEEMRADSSRPLVATPHGVVDETEDEIKCRGLKVCSNLEGYLRCRTQFNPEGGMATW